MLTGRTKAQLALDFAVYYFVTGSTWKSYLYTLLQKKVVDKDITFVDGAKRHHDEYLDM